jgi:hypothetical protein
MMMIWNTMYFLFSYDEVVRILNDIDDDVVQKHWLFEVASWVDDCGNCLTEF